MKKIRIAQIGINRYSHGGEIFNTLKKMSDVFDIVGYALVENERESCVDKLSVFDGYKELTLDEILNDDTIEAVTVETDEIHLLKYALLAAEHGKHIHMEKPGSPSYSDFEKLVNTMKKSGKVFNVGYMYRYNPYVQDIFKRVESGELGKVYSVDAEMSCRHGVPVREFLKEFPGGMNFYLGCHLVDLVLRICGVPEKIIPLNKSTGLMGVDSEDFGMAVLEYKNGVSTVKTSAAERGGFIRRRLCVACENGTIDIQPLEMVNVDKPYGIKSYKREALLDDWFLMPDMIESEEFDRYLNMIAAFADMVNGKYESPYTPDYELLLFRTVLECCGVKNIQ